MNITVIVLAAAILVIAVLLGASLHKRKKDQGSKEPAQKAEPAENSTKKTAAGPETESPDGLSILKISNAHEETAVPEPAARKTELPKEFDDLLQQEKKTADEKKKENENLFPNAHVHKEASIARAAVSTSAVDQVVNQMMDDIMKSLETSTGSGSHDVNAQYASADIASEEEDETPLRQLMKASRQKEDALDLDLLSQIEAVNSTAEANLADSDSAEEEDVTVQQIQQMIEKNVQQETVPEETEEMHVIPADADLMEQIEAVNQAAEEGGRMQAEENTPETAPEEETEEENSGMPLTEIPLKYSIFSKWEGRCGSGDPVLFIFRSRIYYDVFLDTICRMYEKELYPAYPFFVCFCEDRRKEDRAVDEISSWFFENHCEVSRILCDTINRYPVHDGICCFGAGTGTLLDLRFGSMSELGKAEISRIVDKAVAEGMQCVSEESGLRILSADNDSAEAVLGEIEEVGEHYHFSVRISAQQNASDICSQTSAFVHAVSAAIKRTFRGRKTEAVVMPATEWNGSLRGYEAVWYAPAASRAVSFYLNFLCLG